MTSEAERRVREQLRKQRNRTQLLLMGLDDWMYKEDANSMVINSITVRHGRDRGGELLVIMKASFEGRPYVAFHSAMTAEQAINGALERVRNNQAKWKEDHPYEPPKQ